MIGVGISVRLRLWHGVRTIEEKCHNFFENFCADVHGTVDAVAWLRPIHFTHADLPFLSVSAITEFNPQQIATQNYSHAMKGIAMPRSRFPGRQPLSPDQVIAVMPPHGPWFSFVSPAFLVPMTVCCASGLAKRSFRG